MPGGGRAGPAEVREDHSLRVRTDRSAVLTGRFPAIEGRTWNHPALVGDIVLVRNGEEMAAFRLPPAN